MKRVLVIVLSLIFLLSSAMETNAQEQGPSNLSQQKIVVHLKPDVTVQLNDVVQTFRDSNGTIVYPIIYNGSTYLPVRSISVLMNEPIEWDGASKTVFIGKTLSDPSKSLTSTSTALGLKSSSPDKVASRSQIVSAYLKPDVLVMYDFVLKTFEDENGNQVYPIIYNGTTYLPIRAISELMKEPIEWNGVTKTIFIGDGEETQQDSVVDDENEISAASKKLTNFFEREEILYYEATAKTTSLKQQVTMDEKMRIAEAISDNYINAQNLTVEIKMMDTSNFTESEMNAYYKIEAFADSTEYYILVLENIAYLAAQDNDYSMLAETFLYFALDSQTKMEEARTQILEIQ